VTRLPYCIVSTVTKVYLYHSGMLRAEEARGSQEGVGVQLHIDRHWTCD
jgi:hypothetical protein